MKVTDASTDPTEPEMTSEEGHSEMMAVQDMHPNAVVRKDTANSRYVIEVGGDEAGFAAYEIEDGRTLFVHTEIQPAHEREGLGSRLAQGALDDVAARSGTIVPICPFIASWIDGHPDYQSLVDEHAARRLSSGDDAT